MPKVLSKCAGAGFLRQHALDKAGAGDHDVDRTLLILHDLIKPIEIFKIGDVSLHGGDVAADFGFRLVELALPAADDEDIGALFDEFLGGGQTNAARAPGDDGDFSIEF